MKSAKQPAPSSAAGAARLATSGPTIALVLAPAAEAWPLGAIRWAPFAVLAVALGGILIGCAGLIDDGEA